MTDRLSIELFEAFDDDVDGFPDAEPAPEHRGQLMTTAAALAYMTAGKATVTLVSTRTGTRFTYRVTATEDRSTFFVGVLSGPDNGADYRYAGRVARNPAGDRFWAGRKVPRAGDVPATAPSSKAFAWTWRALQSGTMPEGLEVWHESFCGRCGQRLTVPSSVSRGFGPECATKVGLA